MASDLPGSRGSEEQIQPFLHTLVRAMGVVVEKGEIFSGSGDVIGGERFSNLVGTSDGVRTVITHVAEYSSFPTVTSVSRLVASE